ncbi:DUF4386 domain-containing protein [Nonomuraea typhae]|uniref:DUF4386 domain-containing protein n=1 Tax=Nonomuraea typhae TaxID=2603600 RepID=UPI0012F8FCC1|nr:DUF4386 domain-containing protein [Nonomuraea typhae]
MRKQTLARVTGTLFLTATAAGVLSTVVRGPGGGIMALIMAVAIAMIAPTLFPILKEYGEAPALGYVVTRTLEVVLLLPAAIGPLSGGAVPGYAVWGHSSVVFFCLSVVLLNVLLYRSRFVPRWISGWALAAVAPYLAGGLLVVFGVVSPDSPVYVVLFLPLAVNEMVLAVRLLVKGSGDGAGPV